MISAAPDEVLLDTLRTLRQTLHSVPEPAGAELLTAGVVSHFLATYEPEELITGLGGHGVAAIYRGIDPGPTLMVRCELDALPIEPDEVSAHGATGVAEHRCGHDGHMAIVCGLAALLHYHPPRRGRVVLLFQPAEETGEGAQCVVDDPAFVHVHPDVVLGLHNLPGYPVDAIVLRRGLFSSASVGLHVHLEGVGSHAAQPQYGRTPAPAVAALLEGLPTLAPVGDEGRIATVTHAHLGRPSFGLTPGHGEVWTTLRAYTSDALAVLRAAAESLVIETAARYGLTPTLTWREGFPELRNEIPLVELLEHESRQLGLPVVEPEHPFAWSEDFGIFAHRWPSLFFGLGIGEHHVPLHQTGYQFPDASVGTGLRLFARMLDVLSLAVPRERSHAASG